MDQKTLILLITALVSGFLFFAGAPQTATTHHLITAEKAEAFALFAEWQVKQGKIYREVEETSYRFGKFFENFKFVKEHNARFAKGLETFDVELNQFADLDRFEFKAIYTGLQRKKGVTKDCTGKIDIVDNLPSEVDWSNKAVNPVRNQGQCGSCWAFSATGALEGLAAIQSGKMTVFSPQQLVDCAGGPYENEGCNGGEMDSALRYTADNGVAADSQYPYKAKDGKCVYTAGMNVYQNKQCAEVPANNTKALASAVFKQPVAIAVEADQISFQFYRSGVFSGNCGTDLDHGITLTGYGSMNGKDFWRCKNSWGPTWGQSGYIFIEKTNQDGPGKCGIMMENVVPL